jgi:hypothetical protein
MGSFGRLSSHHLSRSMLAALVQMNGVARIRLYIFSRVPLTMQATVHFSPDRRSSLIIDNRSACVSHRKFQSFSKTSIDFGAKSYQALHQLVLGQASHGVFILAYFCVTLLKAGPELQSQEEEGEKYTPMATWANHMYWYLCSKITQP